MKKFINIILLTILTGMFMISGYVSTAQITGSTTPNPSTGYEYNCFNDGYYLFTTPTWTISPASAGNVLSVRILPDHYNSVANIKWNGTGTATITCKYGTSFTETLVVNVTCATIPSAPTTTSISIPVCGTSGAATIDVVPGTNGDNAKWYAASSGGSALGNEVSYTTSVISTATTYYVSSTNSGGYCESTSRYAVNVPINPAVSVPTAKVDNASCISGAVTISATPASPATSIRWYTSDAAGDAVATGTSYSPSLSTQGDYYYYAASYNTSTGCSSATRLAVKASYRVPPGLMFTAPPVYGSGSVEILATPDYPKKWAPVDLADTTNFQVRWFASSANATANTNSLVIAKGLRYNPSITANTTYYARVLDKVSTCVGPVSTVTAYAFPLVNKLAVKTEVIRVAGKKTDTDLLTLTDDQRSVSMTHIDGLGRVSQQIAVKASPSGTDIIQPIEYDAYGRVSKSYLPYRSTSTDGAFHSGYGVEQYNYYQLTTEKIANDTYPFAKTVYEASPLGRVVEQTNVGQAWQPGSGHTGTITYGFNTGSTSSEAEEVRKLNADGSSSGFYGANILNRTEGTDADGNKVITFTDPADRTIVTKQQLDENVESVSVSYLETYYTYDDFGQVKLMIQPKGVAALKANAWTLSQSIKDQYVFEYVYDKRGRAIETKTPGKGWSYAVYNQLNQVVLTQDPLLRATNKWLYIKYDRQGRVVMTGLHTDNTNTTRSYFQTLLNNKNYASEKYFESRNTAGTHKYTNDVFPTSNTEVLSVTYYDTYDFDSYGAYTAQSISGEGTQGSSVGKVTGSKTLVHGTSDWLKKFVYYDSDGRVIQVRSNNHLNLTSDNLTTTIYDFEKVVKTKTYHNSGTPGNTTVLNTYEYYDQGRLKGIKQKNNSDAEQLVVKYEYNGLGQVVDKKLHETGSPGSGTFIQSVDYRYTINGQLKSINNSELSSNTLNDETNDYFGMELLYNASQSGLTTTQRYNGAISAIKWKSLGGGSTAAGQKSYTYSYDKSGKLKAAAYQVSSNATTWTGEGGAQDEALTYDRNGNIKSLTRKQRKHQLTGITGSYTNETVDNLTYTYKSTDNNSLEKVTDAASTSAAAGFDNGSSSTSNDYTYDVAGNITADLNKGISSIVYNFMGKPTQVNFSDGRKIEYVYDAGGMKLTQKLYQGTTLQTTTHYADGFVYEAVTSGSPVLSFFGSPEGRVIKNGSNLEYQYSIADHQGNTRIVFTSATPAVDAPVATFEGTGGDQSSQYLNVPTPVSAPLANHTPSGSKAIRLNQAVPIGPAKSLKVYPGDQVTAEVWAYYESSSGYGSSQTLSTIMAAVASAFGGVSGGSGESGRIYTGLNNAFGATGLAGNQGEDEPAAYLNYILFDKNYNLLKMDWEAVTDDSNLAKAKVEFSEPIQIKEEGYLYIYLSYENVSDNFVYFDDFKVSYTKTNVIQYNEYYPFGLQTSTSWTRDQTKDNNYLYNAANELNKTSGCYEMYYRGYDPAIGRMLQIDPYATSFVWSTTYNYALNNPVMMNDPSGGQTSVVGYTDSQLHTMFRQSRFSGGTADFGDWAFDNLDGRDAGDRNINGGDGNNYAFDVDGTLVKGGVWVEYSIGESDRKGGLAEVYASVTVFEENDGTRYEPRIGDAKDSYTFQVIHASRSWDLFMETTVEGNVTIRTAVKITYNTNKKDLWGPKYGRVVSFEGKTKVWTKQADGTVTVNHVKYNPTSLMKEWIESAKDHHCGGCLTAPTAMSKYINFILSKDNSDTDFWGKPKVRPTGNGVER